jgi:anti-sigma factor RsiW
MNCTLDHHLLEGYLDGELGFERTLELETHLASCRGCSSEVQSWKEIRGSLERSDLYYRAAPRLEEKIRTVARREAATRPVLFERWLWAGGGAAFATAALLIAFMLWPPPNPAADQEIVTSHVRSLMANHLMDVTSTD